MAMDYMKAMEVSGDAFWVGTQQPDKFDAKGRYSMVIGNLSDATVKAIEAIGGKVQTNPNKENQGRYIKLKSGYPINAHTPDGDQLQVVGNGSKITVSMLPAKWEFVGKSGVNYWVGRAGVTVTDLKVYVPDDVEDDIL